MPTNDTITLNNNVNISNNKAIRQIWFICGLINVGLGTAGYILPVMPGTTFMIIALYCFAKSSEKMHNWMLYNKYFGKTLRDFKAGNGMSIKAKFTALFSILLSISISMYFASNSYVRIFLLLCFVFASACVLIQKTKK